MKLTPCNISANDKSYYSNNIARCGAKTRQGTLCCSPVVIGKNRCRMHGGAKGSGAPKGSQNALKHGLTTRAIKEQRRYIKILMKDCLAFVKNYE